MMRHVLFGVGGALLALAVFLGLSACGRSGTGGAAQRYAIASGGQTGVYYPTAQTIANLARRANPNLLIDVRTSGGSTANARQLQRGEADLAILQDDIAHYAREGQFMFEGEKISTLMGVASLYPEHVQIVARADAGIQSLTDLRGKRVAIGAAGSGTAANAEQILEACGLSTADLAQTEMIDPGTARDYLQDGRVDAAFFTFGVGTAAIADLAYQMSGGLAFVPIEEDVRRRLRARYPFYKDAVIPAGAYEGLDHDVPTLAVTAILVAREQVPAEVVRDVLKGIFDHLEEFQRTHARLQAVNLQDAQANLTLAPHPGAEQFYREAGLAEE